MTATTDDITRISRATTAAQVGVAAVVMTGSAISSGIAFRALADHTHSWTDSAVGVITGLGVDLALASGLIIGHRLRSIGVTTRWGTVLIWMTGVMTLCLNSGSSFLHGQYALAVAHAFLPALLVVLTEHGSEAQLKLHHLAGRTEQHQPGTPVDATQGTGASVDTKPVEPVKQAPPNNTTRPDKATRATVSVAQQRPTKRRDIPATREQRREWVRQQRANGHSPTGRDVNTKFGPPLTGHAVVNEVDREEGQKPALRSVGGPQ